MLGDVFQGGSSGCGRGGPHQEYCLDIVQRFIQSLWKSQISTQYFNLWRQPGRVWVANHGANISAGRGQLQNNVAADITGASDDENAAHATNA